MSEGDDDLVLVSNEVQEASQRALALLIAELETPREVASAISGMIVMLWLHTNRTGDVEAMLAGLCSNIRTNILANTEAEGGMQ